MTFNLLGQEVPVVRPMTAYKMMFKLFSLR